MIFILAAERIKKLSTNPKEYNLGSMMEIIIQTYKEETINIIKNACGF